MKDEKKSIRNEVYTDLEKKQSNEEDWKVFLDSIDNSPIFENAEPSTEIFSNYIIENFRPPQPL